MSVPLEDQTPEPDYYSNEERIAVALEKIVELLEKLVVIERSKIPK